MTPPEPQDLLLGGQDRPVSALVVEGSPVARGLLEQVLQDSLNTPVQVAMAVRPRDVLPLCDPPPDLALIDVDLDAEDAVDLLRRLPQGTLRIATTLYDDEERLMPAFHCRIHGYLFKQDPYATLVESLQRSLSGTPVLSAALSRGVRDRLMREPDTPARMLEVLEWLGRGLNIREAAREAGCSMQEVEIQVEEAYRILGRTSYARS